MNAKRAILSSLLVLSLGAGVSACSVIEDVSSATAAKTQAPDLKTPAEAKNTFDNFIYSLNADNRAVIKGDSKKNMNTSSSTGAAPAATLSAQYPTAYASIDPVALGDANVDGLLKPFIVINSIDPHATVSLDEKDVKVNGNTATFSGGDVTVTMDGKPTKGSYVTGNFTMTFNDNKWLITGFTGSVK